MLARTPRIRCTLFMLAFAVFASFDVAADEPIFTSMVQLLAHPEKYNGKLVDVSGYLHVRYEDAAIYFSKTDADFLTTQQAFWTDYREDVKLQLQSRKQHVTLPDFDCRYVSVRGIFDSRSHGHMGMFPGTIRDISILTEEKRYYDGKRELTR